MFVMGSNMVTYFINYYLQHSTNKQNMATEQQMMGWFSAIDKDKSGALDGKELQVALRQAGLNFSLMTAGMMLRLFDPSKSAKISYNEFKNLFGWIGQKQQAFGHFDADRSGNLNRAEVYNAVAQAFPHMRLDQPAFEAAFSTYDPDRSQSMSYTEYVAFCGYLEHCSRTFISFDAQRSGSVTMNMSQCMFIFSCFYIY